MWSGSKQVLLGPRAMARSTSFPLAPVFSATAIAAATADVPACTAFRKSLSSEAAESLISAFTRAAQAVGKR